MTENLPGWSPAAVEELRGIVASWVNEGFTTPPYTDAQYEVFERLGLDSAETPPGVTPWWSYDTRRHAPLGDE